MGCRHDARAWTPEEDAELAKYLKANIPKPQIARAMGRADSSIYRRVSLLEKSTKPRLCMCCRKAFNSEGPHHRLCGTCRTKNLSPYAY